MKKLTPLWVIFVLIGLLSIIAVSFGYFVANISINGSISDIFGSADATTADITLTNLTENVTLVGAYPMTRSEAEEYVDPYTFTITNNSLTKGADVQIVLETKSGTNTIPDRLIDAEIKNKTGVLTNTNIFTSTPSGETGYQSAYVLWRGTINPGSQTFNLLLWIDELGDNSGGANDVQNKSWYGKIVIKALEAEINTHVANEPNLVTNLIPVVYNKTTDKWVMSNTVRGEWYDYDELKWANAVTVKSEKRGTYVVGDIIEMSDILGMWVWIPRYEYNYTNLGEQYAGGTQAEPGQIDIKFISGTSSTEDTGYIIHPAFRNGSVTYSNNAYTTTSAYQVGGWDSEITGFWMGKFETSSLASAKGTTSEVLSDPIVKPNVRARRYQTASDQYKTLLGLDTYHGIALDSHMSKNSEWGAVAYLSQSDYGKYGNSDYSGANKEIYANDSMMYYTGRSMGTPSGTDGSIYTDPGTYQYNNALSGTGASTTGTIYGIYDMVGGAWERQMGWLNTASTNFGYSNNSGTDTNSAEFDEAPSNHRYYDEYTSATTSTACGGIVCYGHALSETQGWYNDFTEMILNSYPWFVRGTYNRTTSSIYNGIYAFSASAGNSNYYQCTRAVLT